MHINATFIVQMINFALSYMVLSKFLLKPFMQAIQQKQAARQTLSTILDNKGLQEQQLVQSKQDLLTAFRAHVHDTYKKPVITPAEQPCFEEKPLADAHIQEMVRVTATLVIEKVSHV